MWGDASAMPWPPHTVWVKGGGAAGGDESASAVRDLSEPYHDGRGSCAASLDELVRNVHGRNLRSSGGA